MGIALLQRSVLNILLMIQQGWKVTVSVLEEQQKPTTVWQGWKTTDEIYCLALDRHCLKDPEV